MTQGVKFIFTDEQIAWFIENFPDLPNAELCEKMDCKETTVHRLARQYKLTKSEKFLAWREEKSKAGLRAYCRVHPPKGNEEAIRPYRFRKGESIIERLGEDRFRRLIEKGTATRLATAKLERARIAFGLEQKTKMHLKRQPQKKIQARYYLKKKGYIIDDENLIAYWTDTTIRAYKLEARPRKFYTFKSYAEHQ